MSDLMALYQEVILDHNKQPRNFGELPESSHQAEGHNPLCGDEITLQIEVADDRIVDLRFRGQGCAISTASASLMTEAVKGRTIAEAAELFERFHDLLTGDPSVAETPPAELGKLAVFAGVREFPIRVKCATLAWHTLQAALREQDETISTE